jgi:hypothetical protein
VINMSRHGTLREQLPTAVDQRFAGIMCHRYVIFPRRPTLGNAWLRLRYCGKCVALTATDCAIIS